MAQTSSLQKPVEPSLKCYTSEQVPYVWDEVAPFIQKALDRGSNYTLDDIESGLLNKEMQLWVWQPDNIEAALVTTILNKKGVRFCLFLALGGNFLDDWIQYLHIVEDWARDNGCDEMRIYGRIGWARHIGYDIEYTKMSKEL